MKKNVVSFFNKNYLKYNRKQFVGSDPVLFAHRYVNKNDQECVAFLSACFAYGRVAQINLALEKIFSELGPQPAESIRSKQYRNSKTIQSFYYRFHKSEHLFIFLDTISKVLNDFSSLGAFFKNFYLPDSNLEKMLNLVSFWFENEFKSHPLYSLKNKQGLKFLINSPKEGSACKRMMLFLRWMSRKDDIDLGLWSDWLSPSALLIPVDTHIAQISYFLKLRSRKLKASGSWKMANEITEALRQLNSDDPVSYDFSLTRLGILNLCKKKYVRDICSQCDLQTICRYSVTAIRTNSK